jgi:hypothetical protein
MQDLRYAGPSIGELSTITGGRGNDCQPNFAFSCPNPAVDWHVFVAACQFLHLADAKPPPKVKRNRRPQGAMGACTGRGAYMSASEFGFAMVKAILIIVSALTVILLMAWYATHASARSHRAHRLPTTQGKSIAGLSGRQRVLLRKGGRLPL